MRACSKLNQRLSSLPGRSGRGRPRWVSSCWRRPGTTPPCRGCSHPRTSTRKAWCPTWTPERPSTCTEAPRRPRPACRDPWSPGSCCTAWGAASRLRCLYPPCPACLLGRLSGEPIPAGFPLFFCTPNSAGLLRRNETKTDTNKNGTSQRKRKLLEAFIWCEAAD